MFVQMDSVLSGDDVLGCSLSGTESTNNQLGVAMQKDGSVHTS